MSAPIAMQALPVKVSGPGHGPAPEDIKKIQPEDCSFAVALIQALTGLPGQEPPLIQADPAELETSMAAQIWTVLARPVVRGQEMPGTSQGQLGAIAPPADPPTSNNGPSLQNQQLMQLASVENLSDPAALAVKPEPMADPVLAGEPSATAIEPHQVSVITSGADTSNSEQPENSEQSDAEAGSLSHRGRIEKTADEQFEPGPVWTSDQPALEMAVPEQSQSESTASQSLSKPGLDWEHLVAAIVLEKQPDGQRLTVRLRPDTMGQLEILFEQSEQGLSARIVADNPETTQLLGSQVQTLQSALADKGIACASIAVVYEQSAFTQDHPFQQHQGQSSPQEPPNKHDQGQGSQSIPSQQDTGGREIRPPLRHPVSSYIDRWT